MYSLFYQRADASFVCSIVKFAVRCESRLCVCVQCAVQRIMAAEGLEKGQIIVEAGKYDPGGHCGHSSTYALLCGKMNN